MMQRLVLALLLGATLVWAGVWWFGERGNRGPGTGGSATTAVADPSAGSTRAAPVTAPGTRTGTTTRGETRPAQARLQGRAAEGYRRVEGRAGYWQLGQTWEGVWWLVSPEGKREWLNTVTTVQPFQKGRDPGGAHFVSRDWDGGLSEKGDHAAWARKTLARVKDAGFKGLGAWCNPAFHDLDVPMTKDLNLWKWVTGDDNHILFYSPEWAKYAENGVRQQVIPLRENRNLVGYFSDNELDWGDKFVGPRVYFDNRPPTDPNRVEVVKVIRQLWPDVAAFNRDWGTELKAWDDLDAMAALPLEFGGPGRRKGNYAAYVRLLSAFTEHLARDYFRVTTGLIRQYDPNHLILGVRFKGWAPPEVVRAQRGYTDAVSLNYYVGDAKLDREMFLMMHRESGGQPVMITEYSFHSLDGRSGNRNTVGFAAQVLDQRARAEGYRLKTTRLARVPWVVGADWFQWADEPPSGRWFDGEDVNFGIVDIDDREYEHMVRAVRETTPVLNDLHERSGDHGEHGPGEDSDIWRESYANRLTARVPYLSRPPTLNGELSDWPTEARLAGVRHARTLGLERSKVPLPNFLIGWREEGLYLAFEVFDEDIQGADPKGWWWTRDCVEWWVSTRSVPREQNWYDGWCHQFFFVPREFPVDGMSGVVGRWHRPGDAISDNLIPEPNVRQVSRVLPGRYVVEVFMPAGSLNGWDPVREPRLSFNLHVRNWQHAIDHFWSAPKEMQTQLRPNTWGTVYLAPRP